MNDELVRKFSTIINEFPETHTCLVQGSLTRMGHSPNQIVYSKSGRANWEGPSEAPQGRVVEERSRNPTSRGGALNPQNTATRRGLKWRACSAFWGAGDREGNDFKFRQGFDDNCQMFDTAIEFRKVWSSASKSRPASFRLEGSLKSQMLVADAVRLFINFWDQRVGNAGRQFNNVFPYFSRKTRGLGKSTLEVELRVVQAPSNSMPHTQLARDIYVLKRTLGFMAWEVEGVKNICLCCPKLSVQSSTQHGISLEGAPPSSVQIEWFHKLFPGQVKPTCRQPIITVHLNNSTPLWSNYLDLSVSVARAPSDAKKIERSKPQTGSSPSVIRGSVQILVTNDPCLLCLCGMLYATAEGVHRAWNPTQTVDVSVPFGSGCPERVIYFRCSPKVKRKFGLPDHEGHLQFQREVVGQPFRSASQVPG
ncbi:hypothetical protein F5141DRAFT_1063637 [Pisolithus sp. B1]|nr:hypothetical protein F5141DRAFT_1063637 [Pisolithus sp. B1]